MTQSLSDLSARYTGPIPKAERLAAKYGPMALQRISLGGDMNWIAGNLRAYAVCLKHAVRTGDQEARAKLLLRCQEEHARWKKYRARYRAIMAEIRALERDRARGLYRSAAE